MSLSNKREVREHVKTLLQSYADEGHIDMEEMKTLTKDVADAVTNLPAAATVLTRATLAALKTLLESHSETSADVLQSLTEKLKAETVDGGVATSAEAGGSAGGPTASSLADTAAAPAEASPAVAPASLSFSAFKARMAKKRDELKAERETVTEVAAAPAPATVGSAPLAPSAPLSEAPGTASAIAEKTEGRTATAETDPTESRNLSARGSTVATPLLRPSATAEPESVPSMHDEAAAAVRETAVPSPPVQQQRETFVLTAAPDPDEEVDLYADLSTYRGRGLGRGRGRGRGRGWGRGGPFPHYPPAPNHYGPPPPNAYRGGYAPQPHYYRPY